MTYPDGDIANGEYQFGPGKGNRYTNEFSYDTIGNFTRKSQLHKIIQPSAAEHLPKETNYLLNYKYTGQHPHAVTDAGDKLYSYDNNGNMTGWDDKTSGKKRTILWNEENRVKEIQDNGKSTYFLYDDAGERVLKRGQHGETFYINRFYSIRNGELGTKSIYAGNTRIVSKLVKTPNTVTDNTTSTVPGIQGLDNGQGRKLGIIRRLNGSTTTAILPPEEKDQFFYHGDHLGSSNMITDSHGAIYQHLEYFPYGETWIEEGGSYGGNTPGYKFTGKELDPETGLYYFGARYYEPVISRWISADPILVDVILNKERRPSLSRKLQLFSYGLNNPIKLLDPYGLDEVIFYYTGDKDKSFEKAANTFSQELQNNNNTEPIRSIGVRTETDFKREWNKLESNQVDVTNVTIFSHGGVEAGGKGALYFKPDSQNDGMLDNSEIASLGKLNYSQDAAIDLHSCKSGSGETSAAQSFANSQGVPATGRTGYAYFSLTKNKYTESNKNSTQLYLDSYSRGMNSLLGSGALMPTKTASPKGNAPVFQNYAR